MHRFFLPPEKCRDAVLRLSESDAHHAADVLRVRPGERVVVLDGVGDELMCTVEAIAKHEVTVRVTQRGRIAPLPYQITLVQALTKSKTLDTIIQKAVELGAARVVLLQSERSVSQIEEDAAAAKLDRWQTTVIEAAKQCGAAWLTRVEGPLTPQAWLAKGDRFDVMLLASLQSDAKHPRVHIEQFIAERGKLPVNVAVCVGPEGDYTPAELNAFRGAGALPITLGQLVLRSETASAYCLAALNYELQAPRK
ncbi:MAG: 16S rRNA (uracil(1498)-N(3))-methyltransferase [Verrucomicrobia bacterium]|nr:16S rRNA (uracil(1498)-N(3))-methyltransferase [Verrucomicrobiota bacterium]